MISDVFVTGRFPPPLDGQALATARLATILEPHYPVRRFNTMPAQQDLLPTGWRQGLQTTRHYLHQRSGMRRALAGSPAAAVLWCAISPSVAGHFRDILTSVPCFRGHPVCAVVHRGKFDRLFTRKATLPSARRLANRINLFAFLSQSQAESVADWIPAAKLRVVPNTIDAASLCTPAETAKKQRSRQDRQELRLLFLSNMIPSKGYLHVLEAIAIARKRGRAVTGTFAGRWNRDGDRHAFLRRVQALKLDDAVTHLGPVTDRAAVKALHLGADVLALPTFYENEAQPLALIEALCAATPVIVTQYGSIGEMVRGGKEALFVRPQSPCDIADAIDRLSSVEQWSAASSQALARFAEKFSAEAVCGKWQAIVEELAQAPR